MPSIMQIIGIATVIFCMGLAWKCIFRDQTYVQESGKWRASWLMVVSGIVSMAIW